MANKLTVDQVQLTNERIYSIAPVKVKYMLLGFYSYYMTIKRLGLVQILGCSDGYEIVNNFLVGSLDSEELASELLNEMNAKDMSKILEITKRLNELKEEPEIKNETPPMIQ